MSKTVIIPGRGAVKVSNSFCGAISYSSGNSNSRPNDSYTRLKNEVEATGNKWAMENFHATHD